RARPLHVLFLQGPCSYYMEQVGRRLIARGHRVSRVNLHFGDKLFWRGMPAKNYRGKLANWPDYIARVLDDDPITHLILLGDMRAYHRIAIAEARKRGAEIVCAELGYLRPDWLVLERDGMSTHSRMPRDPETIRTLAKQYPVPDFTVKLKPPSFWYFSTLDIVYTLGAYAFGALYPHYHRHAIDHPVLVYLSWIRRLALAPIERRRTARALEAIRTCTDPLFILPLQLSTDFQIRAHSPYPDMETAAREVIASFAAHAPRNARLVVKLHPLDPGLTPWRRMIERFASKLGVGDRVYFVDGGDLLAMLRSSAGCVTVNSTVGIETIREGRPLKVLGGAVFDVPGLVFQGSLDAFWANPTPPDRALTDDFLRLLAGAIHIRGGYYTQEGLDMAVAATVERLENGLPWLPPRD
ncbi:MAG: capsule biosynthesis protein, partial [Pseudorhodoplanes sp.]